MILSRSLTNLWSRLTKDKGAATFFRLAESQHVADLQLIFWFSLVLMLVGSVFAVVWHKWVDTTGVIGSAALISAILATGFGIITWTYQTGGVRLGIVDLFACEITTICRVMGIVELAPRYVQMYREPPIEWTNFNSQEHYTPVFDNNSSDLQSLKSRVVLHVTEFYTYLKAMRDYLRVLGAVNQPQNDVERWRSGLRSVIYMLFLMLESARKSVDRLIEYEPECAENTIVILLSELVAYGLLLEVFEADELKQPGFNALLKRLQLRKNDYLDLVPKLYWRALSLEEVVQWKPAFALIEDLNVRYHEVFGQWIDEARAIAYVARLAP